MEAFQFIPTLFRSSRNFPVHADTLRIIWIILYSIRTFSKISGNSSANNELVAKTFRIRKNFPVSIADALTGFFWPKSFDPTRCAKPLNIIVLYFLISHIPKPLSPYQHYLHFVTVETDECTLYIWPLDPQTLNWSCVSFHNSFFV